MTISDQETFDDFFQVMGERGGTHELLSEADVSVIDAVKGTPDENAPMVEFNIPPLEVNKATQDKIIEHMKGIDEIKIFMSTNAGWDKYDADVEAMEG